MKNLFSLWMIISRFPILVIKGIKKILDLLKLDTGWSSIVENGNIIGLKSEDKGSISLEPGGQFELSGAPLENLHQTCSETGQHLSELKKL